MPNIVLGMLTLTCKVFMHFVHFALLLANLTKYAILHTPRSPQLALRNQASGHQLRAKDCNWRVYSLAQATSDDRARSRIGPR
jgi:hypothetical protein